LADGRTNWCKRGIAPEGIAIGLSLSGFGGIAGAVISASLSARLGRQTALLSGAAGLAVCGLLTLTAAFVPAIILFMFFYTFTIPFYVSILRCDRPDGTADRLDERYDSVWRGCGTDVRRSAGELRYLLHRFWREAALFCYLVVAMLTMRSMRSSRLSPMSPQRFVVTLRDPTRWFVTLSQVD